MHVLRERAIALVTALGVLVAAGAGAGARAESFDDALAGFAGDSYSDTEKAIEAIAASGNPRAAIVIGALQDARLFFNAGTKKVYVKTESGTLLDAATGEAAAGETISDLKLVRINNRLRRAIEASLGSLTLLAPDPAKRLEAAQAVFRSRDAAALPALDAALAKETDAGVKRALTEARAAVILNMSAAKQADQIEAVAVIRARADQDAVALLSALPAAASPAVTRAARDAVAAIQNGLVLWEAAQNAWYGLSLGSVLLLAAIGLAITFGVMGVINMAHGEMVMLGAYTTFVVQEVIRTRYPALFDYSLLIAVPLAFLVAGAIGVLIERSIIRFLYGRPLETLLATWGLSLVLQQAVRTMFGPTNQEVGNPSWMSGAFEIGQITITYNRLWILCFTLAVFVILLAMLRYTSLGLEMRAVTQNRRMAASMGIATSLVGAFTLGIANKFLEPVAGAVLGKIAILVLIILFIQKRPRGLFALKGRAVEA